MYLNPLKPLLVEMSHSFHENLLVSGMLEQKGWSQKITFKFVAKMPRKKSESLKIMNRNTLQQIQVYEISLCK